MIMDSNQAISVRGKGTIETTCREICHCRKDILTVRGMEGMEEEQQGKREDKGDLFHSLG